MKSNTWLSVGLILFAVVVVLGGTWLMAQNGAVVMLPRMMSGSNMPLYAWGGALIQILMLVAFGLSIAGIVLFLLWFGRRVLGLVSPEAPWELPEEILRARFAKGEITRQEFEEMRHALYG